MKCPEHNSVVMNIKSMRLEAYSIVWIWNKPRFVSDKIFDSLIELNHRIMVINNGIISREQKSWKTF
jgi:hypothetical protein